MKLPHWVLLTAFAGATTLTTPALAATSFTDIGAGLTGLSSVSAAWGDYDGDGDLDIAVMGYTIAGAIARVYRNSGGTFADALALPAGAAASDGALAWGDYDRDGDLDLAICGYGSAPLTRIYKNTGGTFTDIGAGLEGVYRAALAWADFDNDGDLDLAVSGYGASAPVAHLYRNTGGVFADAGAAITPAQFAAMAWVDYDVDGDLDLVLSGSGDSGPSTTLYRNTAGVLAAVASGLPGVIDGSLDWADYDNDGDPDLLIGGSGITEVWRNTGGAFANDGSVIQGVGSSAAVWGDYDNDARADLVQAGDTGSVGYGAVYRNTGSGFSDISAGLAQEFDPSLAWGDYDNDGDLDLMQAGLQDMGSLVPIHRIYRVAGVSLNNAPTAPTGLSVTANATQVTFHWGSSTDAQGAPLGLSYNLWAGTSPGTANVVAPMSNLPNGYRRIVHTGNAGENHQWSIARSAFPGGAVYWGVQAVDQAFAGSAFANGPSGVLGADMAPLPARVQLQCAGPNPARANSRLRYSLPSAARVDLSILDVSGRMMTTLVDGEGTAGVHEVGWNGTTRDGSACAPGVYFARLDAGGTVASLRVLRIE